MNGFERIHAALKGEPTDKVPVMLHNFMMAAREAGLRMETFRTDPEKMAGAFIRSVEKYAFDGILVDLDTVTLAGAAGVPVDHPIDEPGRLRGSRLHDLKEVNQLPAIRIEDHPQVMVWLEAVRRIKTHFGNEVFVRGNCDQAPFSLASMIRGMDAWMTDLVMAEEALMLELLAYAAGISGQFLRLMARTGADMLSNGDSPAGPELVSPELYMQYAWPFEKRMVELSHSEGLPYALHICGDTGLILDDMLRTGADALELDYKTDTDLLLEKLAGKTTLIGTIDPSGVLARGTVESVRTATTGLLQRFGREPRFILNAGCAIPADTPPENLRTMIRVAREFR